jgi:hypothetical protein
MEEMSLKTDPLSKLRILINNTRLEEDREAPSLHPTAPIKSPLNSISLLIIW